MNQPNKHKYILCLHDRFTEVESELNTDAFVKNALEVCRLVDPQCEAYLKIGVYDGGWELVYGNPDCTATLDGVPGATAAVEQHIELADYVIGEYKRWDEEVEAIYRYKARRQNDRKRLVMITKRLGLVDEVVSRLPDPLWQDAFDRVVRKRQKQIAISLELNLAERTWKRLWHRIRAEIGEELMTTLTLEELRELQPDESVSVHSS